MFRTQIYLTEAQQKKLAKYARTTGKKQSELIREALDQFLQVRDESYRDAVFKRAAGMWKDRDDLPDFYELRRSWDRR